MNLLVLASLLEYICLGQGQEITSSGQHSSDEFSWAVGVNKLSFNVSFTSVDSSNYYTYIHYWNHVSTNGLDLVTFTVGFNATKTELYGVVCVHGTDLTGNQQIASAYGVDYRIDCTLIDTTLESQFTIESSLNSSYNGSMVKVTKSFPTFEYIKDLELKNCEKLAGNDHLKISGGVNAEYSDTSNCTCSNSILVVNSTFNENVVRYSRTCNYDAKWSDQGSEVECWFAPEANIGIKQNGLNSKGILVSEIACTMNCTTTAIGNPTESSALYYKNGVQMGNNIFSVTSYDNGAKVSCQMANSYVNEVDSSSGFSHSITLDVLYQPESLNGDFTQQQYAAIGQKYTIVISFEANPRIKLSNTALYFNGKRLDSTKSSISYNGTRHGYGYPIAQVGDESFGIYMLTTSSPAPQLAGRVSNFIVILNYTKMISTTEIPHSISSTRSDLAQECQFIAAAAAISACVGLVVGVAVSSAFWWWLRRSRKEQTNKEKMDPPYEPTYVEPDYSVINQETANGEAGGRASSQEQNNVNAAYEVIR